MFKFKDKQTKVIYEVATESIANIFRNNGQYEEVKSTKKDEDKKTKSKSTKKDEDKNSEE